MWYTNFRVFVLLFWHSGLHCCHWFCKLPSSSNTQCNNTIRDIDWEQSLLCIQETPKVMINLKNQWFVGKRMSGSVLKWWSDLLLGKSSLQVQRAAWVFLGIAENIFISFSILVEVMGVLCHISVICHQVCGGQDSIWLTVQTKELLHT